MTDHTRIYDKFTGYSPMIALVSGASTGAAKSGVVGSKSASVWKSAWMPNGANKPSTAATRRE